MANLDTAVCTICGKTYKTCLSCKHLDVTKPWRSITDTVDCYKLFLILSQYNNKHINKEDARKQLEGVSFNRKDLKKSVQSQIEEIMSSNESSKKISPRSSIEKNVNSN